MLSSKLEKAFNEQVNAELYSAYLYFSMASWFESKNLKGFANWMTVQAQEEVSHALKFYHFINERGARAKMKAIDAPGTDWKSPLTAFKAVLEHEKKVTGLIDQLADMADKEKDRASSIFLQWFISEQVEEEASADELVKQLELIGDNPQALLMLDRELAGRVFTPPAEGGEAE